MSKEWVVLTVDTVGGVERIVRRVSCIKQIDQKVDGAVEVKFTIDAHSWVTYTVREPLPVILAALGVTVEAEAVVEAVSPEPAPGSEEDWREALRVVREAEPPARSDAGTSRIYGYSNALAVWEISQHAYGAFGAGHHPTATAAARAYVASRRADPTPGPLVVDGWTLDLDRWARPLPLSGDHGKHDVEAVIFERGPEGVKWWAIHPVKRRWDAVEAGIAPTRAEALAAATAALREHYGRPA